MGRLMPLQIRNLAEPGRYSDGDGLYLQLTGPQKGNWQLRATINGRRRDIGLGSLSFVTLKEAHEAERGKPASFSCVLDWLICSPHNLDPLHGFIVAYSASTIELSH